MNQLKLFALAAMGALVVHTAGAQDDSSRKRPDTKQASGDVATRPSVGRIIGVFDAESGNPVEGAEVIDLFVNSSVQTRASGLVGLAGFQSRNDSAAVRIRKIGYADTAFIIMVGPADTVPVQVYLAPATPVLPKVLTEAMGTRSLSANLKGFEERRNDKSLSGKFVTPEELQKYDGRKLTDILNTLGVHDGLRHCPRGSRVYVDGRYSGLGIPGDIPSHDLEAIEYYSAAAAPLQFKLNVSDDCGILLLWHKEMVR